LLPECTKWNQAFRPVVLETTDGLRWIDPQTPVEEAAHIAQSRSVPPEAFSWWRVTRAVNLSDNDDRQLLEPLESGVSKLSVSFP
jgi:putative SOS response-associated peptidase YedK